jgi:hypothetical protein
MDRGARLAEFPSRGVPLGLALLSITTYRQPTADLLSRNRPSVRSAYSLIRSTADLRRGLYHVRPKSVWIISVAVIFDYVKRPASKATLANLWRGGLRLTSPTGRDTRTASRGIRVGGLRMGFQKKGHTFVSPIRTPAPPGRTSHRVVPLARRTLDWLRLRTAPLAHVTAEGRDDLIANGHMSLLTSKRLQVYVSAYMRTRICFFIDSELEAGLNQLQARDGTPKAESIRRAIAMYLEAKDAAVKAQKGGRGSKRK